MNSLMRRRSRHGRALRLAAAVSAGLVVAALTAPSAQADADGYLRCVKGGLGGYVPDADALQLGRMEANS